MWSGVLDAAPVESTRRPLGSDAMRLGVLDVGSNTVHLLVVDAHRGAQPTPQFSHKTELRLSEAIDADGQRCPTAGAERARRGGGGRLARGQGARLRRDARLRDLRASATPRNGAEVLRRVRKESGVDLNVLPGEDEARLTFLAVRRWYGWSAGNLLCLDIGGGSLELAAGTDEDPQVAVSVPLGAARLTRDWFIADPPSKQQIAACRQHVEAHARAYRPSNCCPRAGPGPGGRDEQDVPHAGPPRRAPRPARPGPRALRVLSRDTGSPRSPRSSARMASARPGRTATA